jgi:hypothetical protein
LAKGGGGGICLAKGGGGGILANGGRGLPARSEAQQADGIPLADGHSEQYWD